MPGSITSVCVAGYIYCNLHLTCLAFVDVHDYLEGHSVAEEGYNDGSEIVFVSANRSVMLQKRGIWRVSIRST